VYLFACAVWLLEWDSRTKIQSKTVRKRPFSDQGTRGMVIVKLTINKWWFNVETGFNWLRRGSRNRCRHGNEPMASAEVGNSEWPAEKLQDSQKPSSLELMS
jgi:hypothetical protein